MIVFSMGLAAFFATLQVYFRDTSQLPALLRPDLDVSLPGAVAARERRPHVAERLQTLIELNPMYSMLGGYAELHAGAARSRRVHVDHRGRLGPGAPRSSASCSSSPGSVSSLSASPDERQTGARRQGRRPVHHLPDHLRAQAHPQAGAGPVRPRAAGGPRGRGPQERHLRACRTAPRWASSAPTAPASRP